LLTASTITGSIGVAGLRPTVTQAFFDKVKITIESFFTGSKSNSMVHALEGEDLERHSRHIDETYDDFKERVCSGRGMDKDVIDLVAGGRVFTGLRAWELVYPPEEQEAQRLKEKSEVDAAVQDAVKQAQSSIGGEQESKENSGVAEIDDDDASSPFAVPVASKPDAPLPDRLASPSDLSPESSKRSEDADKADQPTGDAPYSGTRAFGRGIVDGIGGIRDSAVYAVEIYLATLIQQERQTNPEKPRMEILKELLPDLDFEKVIVSQSESQAGEGGEAEHELVVLPMDLRLKKCECFQATRCIVDSR